MAKTWDELSIDDPKEELIIDRYLSYVSLDVLWDMTDADEYEALKAMTERIAKLFYTRDMEENNFGQ